MAKNTEIMHIHVQSDVDFYGESYDGKHVTVAHCTKKFLYEKPRKSRKKLEYSGAYDFTPPYDRRLLMI